jgi:predicted DNA-binding protein (MmcQ/YjbR family)
MDLDSFRQYCIAKRGVTEETPFGPETLVYKVVGKVFALAPLDVFDGVNLKCDPERAIELRERYEGIIPGYHMNKQHWNTVDVTGNLPDKLIRELVDHSYALVWASLPAKVRKAL